MTLAQFLFNLYFAVLGGVLSVWLAKVVKQNGTVLRKMDEGFKLIARLIVEENDKTRKEIVKALAK